MILILGMEKLIYLKMRMKLKSLLICLQKRILLAKE